MARCTAPVRGHRTASAAAECPVCGGRNTAYSGYRINNYHGESAVLSSNNGVSKRINSKPSWSPASSYVIYTPEETRALRPIRQSVENNPPTVDRRDVFLCHAWDDRKDAARELHDYLESKGVTVWFSDKDVVLGTSLLREIDKGLAKSRVGIVLVTPAF